MIGPVVLSAATVVVGLLGLRALRDAASGVWIVRVALRGRPRPIAELPDGPAEVVGVARAAVIAIGEQVLEGRHLAVLVVRVRLVGHRDVEVAARLRFQEISPAGSLPVSAPWCSMSNWGRVSPKTGPNHLTGNSQPPVFVTGWAWP